jgi:SAM-dependent methyltransferase
MATEMTPAQWDDQFTRQAGWTLATRTHLYRRANLLRASRVLDVGCGTGAITEELTTRTRGEVIGLDHDPDMVAYARGRHGQATYRLGDAHDLPWPDGWFNITVCHFLLMWCHDATRVAAEMVRVTQPGGAILACAEPDYGGRIDHPDLPLRQWQIDGLIREGADPCLGRKLRGFFTLPAVRETEVGLIPGVWDLATLRLEFDAEWALWEQTLTGLVPAVQIAQVKTTSLAAIQSGERLAFLPVFYALIRV